jgi:hypothetical protein
MEILQLPWSRRCPLINTPHLNSQLNYKSKSKSKLLYDWRFTANQFILASSLLILTTRYSFLNWTLAVIVRMQHYTQVLCQYTQKTQPLYCCRGVFTAPLHSNSRGSDHIQNTVLLLWRASMLWALPSSSRCLPSYCLATGLYAIIHSIR